jgi:adenosylcobinamide-phosphate synthase
LSAFHLASGSLLLGAALDALIGDPPSWPHPVRAIGGLIRWVESCARGLLAGGWGGPRAERAAGVVLAAVVVGLTSLAAWGIVAACDRLGPIASLLGRSLLIFWGLAARSLGDEALRVVEAADLAAARRALARIVGRDTAALSEAEVCRACVETVSENCNDAVVAPLFWWVVGGPIGLWAYKAINTLDSMVGYRDARYQRLGWASARLDDLAGLVPARLTWLLIALSAAVLGEDARAAVRVGWRDGRNHPSPNAAWGEAAMAGALRVQLGGAATYGQVLALKPVLGDPGDPLGPDTVRRAVRLMRGTSVLAVGLAWATQAGGSPRLS